MEYGIYICITQTLSKLLSNRDKIKIANISNKLYMTLSTHVDFLLWPIACVKNFQINFKLLLLVGRRPTDYSNASVAG